MQPHTAFDAKMLKRHHPDCHGFGFRAKAAKDSTCRPSHLLRRKLKHNIGTSKHSTLSLDLVFDLSPCPLNRRQTAILKPTHLIARVHSLASIHDSKLFTAGQVGMLLTCHKPDLMKPTSRGRQYAAKQTHTSRLHLLHYPKQPCPARCGVQR